MQGWGKEQSRQSQISTDALHQQDPRVVVCEPKDLEEIIEVCLQSFLGDEKSAGEGKWRWLFGPENRGQPQNWDPKFINGLRYFMKWCAVSTMWWGSVLGVKDPQTDKLIAVAMCFQPGSIKNGKVFP